MSKSFFEPYVFPPDWGNQVSKPLYNRRTQLISQTHTLYITAEVQYTVMRGLIVFGLIMSLQILNREVT